MTNDDQHQPPAQGSASVQDGNTGQSVGANSGEMHQHHHYAAYQRDTLHQLRAPVGDFVGRAEKMAQLEQAVRLMEICINFERQIGHADAEKDAARLEEVRQRLRQQKH
jgi:hypothetical protein